MSTLLKAAAGLLAGVIVGVLTFAFWPRIEPAVVSARPAVEQPTFVPSAVAAKPAPATVVVADKPALPSAATADKPASAAAIDRPAPSSAAAPDKPASASPAASDKAAIDKLAFALRAGPPAPATAPAGASPTRSLAATPTTAADAPANGQALGLRAQGLVALAGGDVAAARAFLERAAEAGDARALLVLGDTYDPATLTRMGALGLKGDPARARDYYARALLAGVAAARDRMAALEARQN